MLIGQGSRFLDPFIFKMKNIIISQLRKTLQDNSKSAAERETARKELEVELNENNKHEEHEPKPSRSKNNANAREN